MRGMDIIGVLDAPIERFKESGSRKDYGMEWPNLFEMHGENGKACTEIVG